MLNALTGWLGISAQQKETIKNEISIMDAIDAHVKWKVRLQDYLNGTSTEELDPLIACRDDQCTLGKWIHGPAQHDFGAYEAFANLRADHAHFHYVASKVLTLAKSGKSADAEQLMQIEYAQTSRKVINALSELNKQVMSN